MLQQAQFVTLFNQRPVEGMVMSASNWYSFISQSMCCCHIQIWRRTCPLIEELSSYFKVRLLVCFRRKRYCHSLANLFTSKGTIQHRGHRENFIFYRSRGHCSIVITLATAMKSQGIKTMPAQWTSRQVAEPESHRYFFVELEPKYSLPSWNWTRTEPKRDITMTSSGKNSATCLRLKTKMKRSACLKIWSKIPCILIPSLHNFVRSMYKMFSTETKNILHHNHCFKHVDKNLVPQNPDILGSTPVTVRCRDHVINEEYIAQSPHRSKYSVYLDVKSAKVPTQMLLHIISEAKDPSAARNALMPSFAISVYYAKTRQCAWNVHISDILWANDE